jgi:putative transposase
MYKVHKIEIKPNNKQRTLLLKSFGVARFVYNWGLAEWKQQYEAHQNDPALSKPNQLALRRKFNSIKAEQFPFVLEVSKCIPQNALINLGTAWKNTFRRIKQGQQAGFPRFHKRGERDGYKLDNLNFGITETHIRLARIGHVRLTEKLRWSGKLISVTLSRRANKFFASVVVDVDSPSSFCLDAIKSSVGVDLGTREYVCSDGFCSAVPRSYRLHERRLRRKQKELSRRVKGSKNREKTKRKVQKIHYKIDCVRSDWLHKLTTKIVSENQVIGIEDLHVKGLVRNRRLSKSIHDASFGEFRRQIEYKSLWHGRTVVVANRFYPSSKICNVCEAKTKHMPLHVREWTCSHCGTKHHRDVNAAINLQKYAVSSTVSACEEFLSSVSVTTCNENKTPPRSRK